VACSSKSLSFQHVFPSYHVLVLKKNPFLEILNKQNILQELQFTIVTPQHFSPWELNCLLTITFVAKFIVLFLLSFSFVHYHLACLKSSLKLLEWEGQKKLWKTKSSRYHYSSNVWNSKDANAFSIKLLDILLNFFYRCVHIGKIFKIEIYFFSFGQSMKKTIMVKVWYFCM